MTISRWTAAGLALAFLLVGAAFGRFATPNKIVERDLIVTQDRDTSLTWHAYVGHTDSKVETKTSWKTVTKWLPGGTVVQTQVAVQDHKETTSTDTTENSGTFKEKVAEKVVVHERLVESDEPDWLLGACVGMTASREVVYAGEVARRIAGPVFVSVQAQKPWAATVGVKLLF